MTESQGYLTAQPYSDKSDHIVDANKMIGEFDRVIEKHSRWLANTPPHVKAHITELKEVHNPDISAALKMNGIACDKHDLVHGWACPLCASEKDKRIDQPEKSFALPSSDVAHYAGRITELESQISELEAKNQQEALTLARANNDNAQELKDRIKGLEAQVSKPCTWNAANVYEWGEGTFQTSCGEQFSFTEGGLTENKTMYCQYCGGKIVEGVK